MKATMAWAAMLASGWIAAGAAQQPARTVQQDFDAATALDQTADAAGAIAAWTALEGRTRPGSRSRAIVQVRRGAALFRVARYDEAQQATRSGLAALPATDPTLREDRLRASMILGRIAADTLDYAGATAAYAAAEPLASDPADVLGVQIVLAGVQTFVDPTAAAATLDRADAIAATVRPTGAVAASLARRHALLSLNKGDFPAAEREATRAVTLLGGLTEQTSLSDVSARSDAAIAYLLGGHADEARRYMAMTGAGRLTKGSFDPAAQMVAPDCGGEAGLKPDDVAVVEFSIAPDGTIARAVPIYAAGGGKVALEFARTVRGWSWSPETIAAMPPFFRHNARVEMRCSTAFTRPSIGDGLDTALQQWLANKGAPTAPAPESDLAAALPGQRAALAAADAKGASSLPTLAALYRLASNPVVPREERAALAARGLAIAAANDAPATARLALELPARLEAVADLWKRDTYARTITPLLSQPIYADDPSARAAVRLMLVDDNGRGRDTAATRAAALVLLRQVAEDRALPAADPLRVGALLRIASIEQAAGDTAKARAAFDSSGIAASQCAVMDAPPRMLSTAGSSAFPAEALSWGFEGWVQVQYDVGADGRSQAARTLLSYPPFIFSAAGTKFIDQARFAKTYRPDGGLGCGGSLQKIRFLLPG